MKRLILVLSLFFSLSMFGSEEGEDAGFYLKLYPSVGAGVKPMTDGNQFYGTVKVFPVQYGLDDIGFSFLGIGYSLAEHSSFSLSPIGLRSMNWMVSMDIQKNSATGAGVSLNYYFP